MPPEPPDGLDAVGEHLWRKVTGTYVFDDPGSYVVLEEACRARQRAARCAKLIDRDGELFEGNKAHPLLRDELQNRALACRLLSRLGLDLEPIKPIGPPPGGFA